MRAACGVWLGPLVWLMDAGEVWRSHRQLHIRTRTRASVPHVRCAAAILTHTRCGASPRLCVSCAVLELAGDDAGGHARPQPVCAGSGTVASDADAVAYFRVLVACALRVHGGERAAAVYARATLVPAVAGDEATSVLAAAAAWRVAREDSGRALLETAAATSPDATAAPPRVLSTATELLQVCVVHLTLHRGLRAPTLSCIASHTHSAGV